MDAKTKAWELASKFNELLYITTDEGYIGKEAKQAAIIACDEVLEEIKQYGYGNPILVSKQTDYWQDVLTELNKL